MNALEHFTSGSSSEFAIRPFIIQAPQKTMKQMEAWSLSDNHHVRRLASEGCRPRLPWAMSLPNFKNDPSQVLKIILSLINDESLYVRRSVANNLNDISKDNPDSIIEIARQYSGKTAEANWVIKHGCRSLLKRGDKQVLPLFGYTDAKHVKIRNFEADTQTSMGDKLSFAFELHTKQQTLGKLRLEFVISFMKANGKQADKIFKISEGEYDQATKHINRFFSFKPISTRKYYPGEHRLSIVINGNCIASHTFRLQR
jgi:3-methyladenine DNA glycosylase AlkC